LIGADLQSATADGASGVTTSTKVDLVFDTAIADLTEDKITITNGTGAAVKGSAVAGHARNWSISLASVTTPGTVSVSVTSYGQYAITGSPQIATVHVANVDTPPPGDDVDTPPPGDGGGSGGCDAGLGAVGLAVAGLAALLGASARKRAKRK
jgi:hypothetical protein